MRIIYMVELTEMPRIGGACKRLRISAVKLRSMLSLKAEKSKAGALMVPLPMNGAGPGKRPKSKRLEALSASRRELISFRERYAGPLAREFISSSEFGGISGANAANGKLVLCKSEALAQPGFRGALATPLILYKPT